MKVGDYCYIKAISRDYGIGKITQLNSGYSSNGGELIDIQFKHSKHSVPKKDVVSSDNPIDLIEVGDYVNGYKVRAVYLEGVRHYIKLEPRDEEGTRTYEKDIRSIVTKEQFEREVYKINE